MQKGLCDQLFQPNIFRVATPEIILLEIGIAFPARHMGGREHADESDRAAKKGLALDL